MLSGRNICSIILDLTGHSSFPAVQDHAFIHEVSLTIEADTASVRIGKEPFSHNRFFLRAYLTGEIAY